MAAHLRRRPGFSYRTESDSERTFAQRVGTADADRSDPTELVAELGAILEWLAPDDVRHTRYQPRDHATFCNVYAHDYCHLAGVYLPRVWWTAGAIERLAGGERVAPRYAQTVDELRANDLFRCSATSAIGSDGARPAPSTSCSRR